MCDTKTTMHPFALPTFDVSLAAAGLRLSSGGSPDIRWLLQFARECGYRAIQLNAADPSTRPRELSRSGRRDLAAHLRRHELVSSGIDLWIPRPHFGDEAKTDRAVAAILDALQFAADMAELTGGERVLSTAIPATVSDGIVDAVAERASTIGVEVANHTYPWDDHEDPAAPMRLGIDPSAVVLAGDDPATAVAGAAKAGRLAAVRLSDLADSGRVTPGDGSLDTLGFRVAVATSGYERHLIIDLRGLPSGDQSGGQLAVAGQLREEYGTDLPE